MCFKTIDMYLVTCYYVSRNREVNKINTKSRADYFKKRREKTRNFSVEVEKSKMEKLENKLSKQNKTKTQWLNEKIDEELSE